MSSLARASNNLHFALHVYGNNKYNESEKVYSGAIHVFFEVHSLQFSWLVGIDVHLLRTQMHCFSYSFVVEKLTTL